MLHKKNFFRNCIATATLLLLYCTTANAFPGGAVKTNKTESKDTVQALVLDSSVPFFKHIENYSADSILTLIDSLLDEKNVPEDVVKDIQNFVQQNYPNYNNNKIKLTGYYDESIYPSNSFYDSWKTQIAHPVSKNLGCKDSTLLVLTDSNNYCDFHMPREGVITSPFGWRHGEMHTGIDIDLRVGDPVYAAFDGMVRYARYNGGGYGRCVVIRHYNGLETLYAHLHRIKVRPGQIVHAGQIIGLGGSTGHSTGSHLHFEVRFKGYPLNPSNIISFRENRLLNDSVYILKERHNYVAVAKGTKFYTIKYGDFLYKIAHRFGTSVKELCELNNIRRNKILVVGRKLRISE